MKNMTILFVCFFLSACGYNNTEVLEGGVPLPGEGGAGNNGPVDFKMINSQVLQPYCFRCHSQAGGNKGGINLETYSQVKPKISRIKGAIESGFMPQNSTLPAGPKSMLIAWINSGAPESAPAAPGNPNPPANPVPQPIPCELFVSSLTSGRATYFDENYYIDERFQTLRRRGDDCED